MDIYTFTIILLVPALIFDFYAQMKKFTIFGRFSGVGNVFGLTGAQAAERLLAQADIEDVKIKKKDGFPTDHYVALTKTIRLSDAVYRKYSLVAIGVACHETVHAVLHREGHVVLALRGLVVLIGHISSYISFAIIFFGLVFGNDSSEFIVNLGINLFSAGVLIQLITLPLELNASARALVMLEEEKSNLSEQDLKDTKKVLNAAAFINMAAAVSALFLLLQLADRYRSNSI